MKDDTAFPCNQCGECCRHIERIPQLVSFDCGDGVCKYLEENKCTIYEKRPEICRVDVMYEKYYYSQYTREEFYRLNLFGCAELRRMNNHSGNRSYN